MHEKYHDIARAEFEERGAMGQMNRMAAHKMYNEVQQFRQEAHHARQEPHQAVSHVHHMRQPASIPHMDVPVHSTHHHKRAPGKNRHLDDDKNLRWDSDSNFDAPAASAPTRSKFNSGRGVKTNENSPSKTGFGEKLLTRLNLPVTPENLRFLDAWQKAEGGSADNPFNTMQSAPGAWKMNRVGVKRYPSMEIGVEATAKALTNGRYGVILAALKRGDNAHTTALAVAQTPWGTRDGVARIV